MNMTDEEIKAAMADIQADVDAHPELYASKDDGKFSWEDVAAGGYSAANSALFGIPDVVVKAASSDAYKELQALKARNKAASLIGDIGGAFIPTGGAAFGLAGKGLKLASAGAKGAKAVKTAQTLAKIGKYADTASDIVKGTKELKGISGGLVRGGLAAAEQVAPRMIGGETSLGEGAGAVALGAGLGGAGKAIGKIAERIPEEAVKLQKWGNKTILKNADINNRILRQAEKYAGEDPAIYIKELAEFAQKNELHREPKLDALVKEVKETWSTIGNKFDEAGVSLADDMASISKMPEIKDVLSRNPAAITDIADLVGKVDSTSNFAAKRKYLNEIIFDQNTPIETRKIAKDIAKAIEEKAESLSGLDIGKAKHNWKMMKPFETADIRDELSVTGAGLAKGSDTASKLALAGLGGSVAGSTQIKGVVDDPTNPEAWGKLLTTTVGGSLTGVMSKTLSHQLAKVARKIDPEALQKVLNSGKLKTLIDLVERSDADIAIPKFIASQMSEESNAESIAKEKIASGEFDLKSATEATDGSEPTGEVQAAQEEQTATYGPEYVSKLNEAMMQYWANNFSDSMTFAEYAAAVAEKTNNFSPEKSAAFIYPDKKERAKFLQDLQVAKKLKDVDLEKTFAAGAFGENFFNPGSAAERKMAQTNVVETIASLVTGEGNIPSKTDLQTISADIQAIMKLPATEVEKKELLMQKLQDKYGLGLSTIRELGLA